MIGVVYCITNAVNGKRYVGITTQPLEQRFKFHLRAKGGCRRLQDSIKCHGADAFSVEAIDYGHSQDDLSAKERIWIDRLGTVHPAGYNLSGGGASNMIVHAETRAAQSKSASQKWQSQDARNKVSEQMKRQWADDPQLVSSHTWSAKARAKRKKTFSDPAWKAMKSASATEANNRAEVRAKLKQTTSEFWRNPTYAKAALAGLRNPATISKRIATMRTPEMRARQSTAMKAYNERVKRIANAIT